MPNPASTWRLIALLSLCFILYTHLPSTPPPTPSPSPATSTTELATPESSSSSSSSSSSTNTHLPPRIPQKIWQTWHTPSHLLNATEVSRLTTWLTLNPSYRYELLTDTSARSYIQSHYLSPSSSSSSAELREIGAVYLALTDRILRADFLRYLVLYASGGVYTDLDTSCLFPIHSWADAASMESAGVVVGIESDREPVENDWRLYRDYRARIWGFNNWTILAGPRHPMMLAVIRRVAANLRGLAREKGRELGALGDVYYKEVIDATGPRAFTEAVVEYVAGWNERNGAKEGGGEDGVYRQVGMLEQNKMVAGDVLVLPIRAMSMLEANRNDGEGARSLGLESMVRHWSEGTWKADHFVIYGEKPEGWKGAEALQGIE